MRLFLRNAILSIMLLIVAGTACSGGLIVTSKEREREWRQFRDDVAAITIKGRIDNEIAGKQPPGGIGAWNKYWIKMIGGLEGDPRDQKYIDYIIQRRHEAGLPPLDGYPPEEDDARTKPEKQK